MQIGQYLLVMHVRCQWGGNGHGNTKGWPVTTREKRALKMLVLDGRGRRWRQPGEDFTKFVHTAKLTTRCLGDDWPGANPYFYPLTGVVA